jgi:N-acetylmuramoyl-L-alanine amidase/chitodextrinase
MECDLVKRPVLNVLLVTLAVSVLSAASAGAAGVAFYDSAGGLVIVQRDLPEGEKGIAQTVQALVAGPTAGEAAGGIVSAIPPGVAALSVSLDNSELTVDLSLEVIEGLDDALLQSIFGQFKATFLNHPGVSDIALTCQGRLLSTYLAPAGKPLGPPPAAPSPQDVTIAGLAGRKISVGPSHGLYWNGSGWYYQRPQTCGLGEAIQEDLNSVRLIQFLNQYLVQDGASVYYPRTLDETLCCYTGYNNTPWWRMAARYWLQNLLPSRSDIWDSSTSDLNDDIRARPKYADYVGADIYIAHHTNAFDGTATGTEVYYDFAMENPGSGNINEINSQRLAENVKDSIEATIRGTYDSAWPIRNGGAARNANGAYGEIRIPNRPACLIELAFHDNCTKDAPYLVDNFFRSVAQWALYKGICDYFGTTPTWDKYSDEYVSDTIPTTMESGKTYSVSVTFRNRGVLWREANAFRLGAVGESDPFTAAKRHTISGEVRAGQTYTFTFNMTAPAPGTYTTDWRMLREGISWFGATCLKTVTVTAADSEPPSMPTGLTATPQSPIRVDLSWTASTDNTGVTGYDIRRNGAIVGTSAGTAYTDTGLTPGTDYTYEVRAKDAYSNVSDWSAPAVAHTPTDGEAPSVPTNLVANATSSTTVALGWTASTDNAGVAGYDIRRDGAIIGSSATNSYNDSGLTAGTSYVYEVRARDSVPNYSGWSAPASVRPPLGAMDVFVDGFDGGLTNWTQTAGKEFAYSTTQNHGSYTGGGAAYCGSLESDQMAHYFDRPFAQGTVSGYFYDGKGGWKTGTCGNAYRQSLSLRNPGDAVTMFLDNCFASSVSSGSYFYRKLGGGGENTYFAYAQRNPNTDCNGAWIYFETDVAPNTPGMSPTGVVTLKVTDGAGTTTAQTDLQTDFFSNGIGKIVLGLGVSSAAESYWDDIRFTASPPGQPVISAANALSSSSIRWDFSAIDSTAFGLDLMSVTGAQISPAHPDSGWLTRDAVSFTETGLAPNSPYARKLRAWNGTLNSAFSAIVTKWTLAAPASSSTVTCDRTAGTLYPTPAFNFEAAGGFGQGTVDYYRYAWNQNPSHTFAGTESKWSSGSLALSAESAGSWYLHVQPFNREDAANGSFVLGPYNYASAVNPIGAAWALADGVPLALQDKVVTHAAGGALWIEEADRSAALKVLSAAAAVRGDKVSVAGDLGLSGPQRVLTASDVVVSASGQQVPAPVWMVQKTLGGQSFNAATPGVTGASGLYNAGLLVSAFGVVTSVDVSDPQNKFFYCDDASGLQDGSGRAGVRVRIGANTEPAVGSLVKVTGVVELETVGVKIVPVILARDAADVTGF